MTDPLLALVERLEEVLNLPDEKKGLALTGKGYVLLYRIRTDLLALAQAGREREAEQERILVAATLRGDYFSERATAAESALARVRGLVGKWRERAAAGIVGDGIALGYGDCATELEALAAAGHEGWLRVGWWLDGPKRSELVFKDVEPDAAIARICAETGDDPEDYTATSVHAQTFSADLGFDSPADQEHRRLATQPGSAGWMPIESAPMDGTRVLLWHDSYRTPMAGYGLTRDDGDMWNVNGTTAHESLRARCPARLYASPTHWQPLPAPPAALAAGDVRESSTDAARGAGEGNG